MNVAGGALCADMELRHLRYFLAVAEEGTFTKAAARLFVAQPALSRQVRDLERHLGEPLFVRGSKGVALTDAGRRLLPRAQRVVGEFDRLLAEARHAARGVTGRVRLGVNIDLARRVRPVLARLEAASPGIRIEPVVYGADGASALLAAGEIDAAVTWWVEPGWEDGAVELFREDLVAVLPAAHDLAHDLPDDAAVAVDDVGAADLAIAMFDPALGAAAYAALADLVRGRLADPELVTEPMNAAEPVQPQMIDLARRRGAGTVVARQNVGHARRRGMAARPLALAPVPVTLIRPQAAADAVEQVSAAARILDPAA